jgi:hypothetical protein
VRVSGSAQALALPPEQPSDDGAEELLRGAAAVVEGCRHGYSKNPRPAFVPSFSIHHLSTMRRSSITSPFENFAAARLPASTMSSTVASSNDLRNARIGGVQFSILNPPTRSQATRSHSGWLMCCPHVRLKEAKTEAHWLPIRSISCRISLVTAPKQPILSPER